MVLTKVTNPILGWVASILGWIINAVYSFLDMIGFPNIGLAIILFTIVVYLLMMPLQVKQHRFSKMNAIMQPEIQKIQKKYKNKKDQESVMKQNEEINAVYQKYGVSPTGSCVQLLIQMPVLLALYQVIYRIPGYVKGVREIFSGLAAHIMDVKGFGDIISKFLTDNEISMYGITAKTKFGANEVIDFLYRLSPSQMDKFAELPEFSAHASLFAEVSDKASTINKFGILDISDTPMAVITSGAGWVAIVCAILIPILAWGTQVLNYKLMPQPASNPDKKEEGVMESSMKSMNTVMPIMSAVFCFSFPVGIGIYWIAGSVIRSIQQVVLNKAMDNMDMDAYIAKNQEKMKEKIRRNEMTAERIQQQARVNTKRIQEKANVSTVSAEEKAEKAKKATEYYNNTQYKAGSIASKANMVKQFDEKGKKK